MRLETAQCPSPDSDLGCSCGHLHLGFVQDCSGEGGSRRGWDQVWCRGCVMKHLPVLSPLAGGLIASTSIPFRRRWLWGWVLHEGLVGSWCGRAVSAWKGDLPSHPVPSHLVSSRPVPFRPIPVPIPSHPAEEGEAAGQRGHRHCCSPCRGAPCPEPPANTAARLNWRLL